MVKCNRCGSFEDPCLCDIQGNKRCPSSNYEKNNFEVIEAIHVETLQRRVNEKLDDGYVLVGGTSHADGKYIQAIRRKVE